MATTSNSSTFEKKVKRKNPGVHTKSTSKLKTSKKYKKSYKGQGK